PRLRSSTILALWPGISTLSSTAGLGASKSWAASTKGGSLACVHATRRRSAKAQNKAEAAGHHMAPPRHADSLAPDEGQGRPLRLRAGGRPRLATAPHSRGPARGALRFSGPVLGRRPSALFALDGALRPTGRLSKTTTRAMNTTSPTATGRILRHW